MKRYSSSPVLLFPIVSLLLIPLQLSAQPKRTSPAKKPQPPATTVLFDSGNSALRIPLEIDNKIILMRVSVNGSTPLRFIFDSGASASAISSKRASELGLKTKGKFQGDATGGKIEASSVEGVELTVQGAKVSNQTIAVIPLPPPPGFEFDGIIGYDFIKQFVVEIDYLQKVMNLYNPLSYHYCGAGASIPVVLVGKIPLTNREILVEGRTQITARLEVDTGGDNTFLLNSPFVKKQRLVDAVQNTTQDTRRGAGGEQEVITGRVKTVRLGPFVFNNPPIMLSLDT